MVCGLNQFVRNLSRTFDKNFDLTCLHLNKYLSVSASFEDFHLWNHLALDHNIVSLETPIRFKFFSTASMHLTSNFLELIFPLTWSLLD